MAIDFPVPTVVGQEFVAAGITYVWNGQGWAVEPSPVGSGVSEFVLKTGDVMSGGLQINKATPTLVLNATGSTGNYVQGLRNGIGRWNLTLGNEAVDTGGNVGSDFVISRIDDTGAWLGNPLVITRSNGIVSTTGLSNSGAINSSGDISSSSGLYASGHIQSWGSLGVNGSSTLTGMINNGNITNNGTFYQNYGQMRMYGTFAGPFIECAGFATVNGGNNIATAIHMAADVNMPVWISAHQLPGSFNSCTINVGNSTPYSWSFRHDGNAYKVGGGMWADSSDVRIKNVLGDYKGGLSVINALRPVRFTFKGNDSDGTPAHYPSGLYHKEGDPVPMGLPQAPYRNSQHYSAAAAAKVFIGLVAQEAESVLPEAVDRTGGYIDGTFIPDLRMLDSTPLVFALINAVKELSAKVTALEARLQ